MYGPGSDWLRAGRFGDRIPVGARFYATVQIGPGAHPASCKMGTGSFPGGGKSDRGVALTPDPLLVPWSRKSRAIPLFLPWALRPVQSLSACTTVHFTFSYTSTPPMDRTACTEPQCLYNGALYLYLYLYSPYGPYSLYRASMPVQRCTLPLPLPLLPLWTVRPVQSLSACTTVHFTFTFYFYNQINIALTFNLNFRDVNFEVWKTVSEKFSCIWSTLVIPLRTTQIFILQNCN